ncbi:MAG: diguanylate cyclase [Spirochaetota bacterium]
MTDREPQAITDHVWWVGDANASGNLRCNPYILFQGGSTILFDPGSVLDWQAVHHQVTQLTRIEDIDAIVLSHQDPDLCSSLPYFEQQGFSGLICCHERAAVIIRYYGISSEFYFINRNKYRYRLKDGTYLRFLPAPYLHFPGAIMSYIPEEKVLISGDLFGAMSSTWELFAGEDYLESMKAFHESYMPSHEILEPVMNQLLYFDIDCICPQHGSVINQNVRESITVLKNLDCGTFMRPVRKDLLEAGGYIFLCSQVLKRYIALYGSSAVREVFRKKDFEIDYRKKTLNASAYTGVDLWNTFFERVLSVKGTSWLTAVSPLVENLSKQYNVPLPNSFSSLVYDARKNQDLMNERFQQLENQKMELESQISQYEDRRARCPVTGLFNQQFFHRFLDGEMKKYVQQPYSYALLLLSIDNLANINLNFGSDEGNASLRNLVYILKQVFTADEQLFRLEGGLFAVYLVGTDRKTAIEKATEVKNNVSESRFFITTISISVGIFHSEEIISQSFDHPDDAKNLALQRARFRLRLARKRGKNSLVYESKIGADTQALYTVLLIDDPGLERNIIRQELQKEQFQVLTADDGKAGRERIRQDRPDIIVAELMTKKASALTLRRELMKSPELKDIPFILMSFNKQENTVKQALSLNITHFLIRPVMIVELLGIIQAITAELETKES